jgi:hypothetical protein
MKKLLLLTFLILFCNFVQSNEINLLCKGKVTNTIIPISKPGRNVRTSTKDFIDTISISKKNFYYKMQKYSCLINRDVILCPDMSSEKLGVMFAESESLFRQLEELFDSPKEIPDFPKFMDNHFMLLIDRISGKLTIIESRSNITESGQKIIYAENKEGTCELKKAKF